MILFLNINIFYYNFFRVKSFFCNVKKTFSAHVIGYSVTPLTSAIYCSSKHFAPAHAIAHVSRHGLVYIV